MKNYTIKITGGGSRKDIANALRQIADAIYHETSMGHGMNLADEMIDESVWGKCCNLLTEIKSDDETPETQDKRHGNLSDDMLEDMLSRHFSRLLKSAVGSSIETIISRNREREYQGCCASHDFCDANEIMNDAFIKVFDRSCILPSQVEENPDLAKQEEIDRRLWNNAWSIAIKNNFYNY